MFTGACASPLVIMMLDPYSLELCCQDVENQGAIHRQLHFGGHFNGILVCLQDGTLLAEEITSLVHWMHADKKREMAFSSDKRGPSRQKPYLATMSIRSGYFGRVGMHVSRYRSQ